MYEFMTISIWSAKPPNETVQCKDMFLLGKTGPRRSPFVEKKLAAGIATAVVTTVVTATDAGQKQNPD